MAELTPPVPEPLENMGQPIARYEAVGKVTGKPIYADDLPVQNPLHAVFLTSGIAKGRITSIDTAEAQRVPGVVKIYTHHNAPPRIDPGYSDNNGYVSDSNMPLTGPDIHNDGQIIAVAVADTFEAANDAVYRIAVRYAEAAPTATFGDHGTTEVHPDDLSKKEKSTGDFAGAFASAPVKVDQHYSTPTQHHNPMELFSTTAFWQGDTLQVHEPSQFTYELRNGVAKTMGIDGAKVRVLDPFVGGAFGSKGMMTQRPPLIAGIARDLGRPIRNVVRRDQGYTLATYRAETQQRVRLGAEKNGKLVALAHDGWEVTSRPDDYSVAGVEATTEMYAVPNVSSHVTLIKADRNTPGFMRAPPETPYMFGLETAMDEMAVALNMDPIEFRRTNDTMTSPINGAPYTSRSLMQCYDQAAAAFGWKGHNRTPQATTVGDWWVGYGCATACYPTNMMACAARIMLTADGRAHVEIAAHDVGTGAYTVMGQIAARELGLDPRMVEVSMGDTTFPPGPVAGGSMTTASAGSAVKTAADKVKARFGGTMPRADDLPAAFHRLGVNRVEEYAEWWPPSSGPEAIQQLYHGKMSGGGGDKKQPNKQHEQHEQSKPKPLMYAFGAQFYEVRVHQRTREVRVPRMVGAFAAGHIVNPRTARSQYLGGMIWGMESALLERTEIDRRRARYVNDNISEYLIATNPDVPDVGIILVPEVDHQVNPLGVKGIGEIGIVGGAAAVSNAVYHATGKRIRDLPITMDKLV